MERRLLIRIVRAGAPLVGAALLLAACGKSSVDRIPRAQHGLARIVYRQVVATSRASDEAARTPKGVTVFLDGVDDAEPAPPAPSDPPQGSWAAVLPVPDLVPLPSSAPQPRAEAAPVQSAVEAAMPAPTVEAQPEEENTAPVAAAPMEGAPLEPQTIVVEGPPPAAAPVTMIVVAPVVAPVFAGHVAQAPRMTVRSRVSGPPAPHMGGARTFVPARPRAH